MGQLQVKCSFIHFICTNWIHGFPHGDFIISSKSTATPYGNRCAVHNKSSIKSLIEASLVITPIFINQIIHNITNIANLKVECKVSSSRWNSAVFAVIAIELLSVLSWYILIARFMGPTWGPSGAGRTQVGLMLAPWTLLSGYLPLHLFGMR